MTTWSHAGWTSPKVQVEEGVAIYVSQQVNDTLTAKAEHTCTNIVTALEWKLDHGLLLS